MSADLADGFTARLRELRGRFVERAHADAGALDAFVEQLGETADAAAERERIRHIAHRMAGAAGTFGFRRLTDLAASLEDLLLAGGDGDALRAKVRAVAAEARRAA